MGILNPLIDAVPKEFRAFALGGGHVIFAIAFALLQEKVFLIPGFKYGGFMVLITNLTYCTCAFAELYYMGKLKPKASFVDYAKLSFTTFVGVYFTNKSMQYLSYPNRIMIKSSKVLPVMAVNRIYLKRKFSTSQIVGVVLLVISITIFSMGDMKVQKDTQHISNGEYALGLLYIGIGVCADAATANFEEKRFFKELKCPHEEIMLYNNLVSAFYALATVSLSGELVNAVAHATEHPEVISTIITFSAVNYFSVLFILMLIDHFGGPEAEIAKSIRKVASITLSFVLFGKTVTQNHAIGGALFVSTVVYGAYGKISAGRAKARDKADIKAAKLSDSEAGSKSERAALVNGRSAKRKAGGSTRQRPGSPPGE